MWRLQCTGNHTLKDGRSVPGNPLSEDEGPATVEAKYRIEELIAEVQLKK